MSELEPTQDPITEIAQFIERGKQEMIDFNPSTDHHDSWMGHFGGVAKSIEYTAVGMKDRFVGDQLRQITSRLTTFQGLVRAYMETYPNINDVPPQNVQEELFGEFDKLLIDL